MSVGLTELFTILRYFSGMNEYSDAKSLNVEFLRLKTDISQEMLMSMYHTLFQKTITE